MFRASGCHGKKKYSCESDGSVSVSENNECIANLEEGSLKTLIYSAEGCNPNDFISEERTTITVKDVLSDEGCVSDGANTAYKYACGASDTLLRHNYAEVVGDAVERYYSNGSGNGGSGGRGSGGSGGM